MRVLTTLLLSAILGFTQEVPITLTWDRAYGAKGYVVESDVANSFNTPSNQITINVIPGNSYQFTVSAYVVPGWEGPKSNPLTINVHGSANFFQFTPSANMMAVLLFPTNVYHFQTFSNNNWVTTESVFVKSERRFVFRVPTNNFRIMVAQ